MVDKEANRLIMASYKSNAFDGGAVFYWGNDCRLVSWHMSDL